MFTVTYNHIKDFVPQEVGQLVNVLTFSSFYGRYSNEHYQTHISYQLMDSTDGSYNPTWCGTNEQCLNDGLPYNVPLEYDEKTERMRVLTPEEIKHYIRNEYNFWIKIWYWTGVNNDNVTIHHTDQDNIVVGWVDVTDFNRPIENRCKELIAKRDKEIAEKVHYHQRCGHEGCVSYIHSKNEKLDVGSCDNKFCEKYQIEVPVKPDPFKSEK